jgi:hypothetical protein
MAVMIRGATIRTAVNDLGFGRFREDRVCVAAIGGYSLEAWVFSSFEIAKTLLEALNFGRFRCGFCVVEEE